LIPGLFISVFIFGFVSFSFCDVDWLTVGVFLSFDRGLSAYSLFPVSNAYSPPL
jgi:hypothetical protein